MGRHGGLPLQKRPDGSHKGDYGHVLVVAGSDGMTGAAYLTALGALRSGAGLVTVASVDKARDVIRFCLPEAMSIGFSEVLPYIRKRRITTLAMGPGLGMGTAQKRLILKCLSLGLPTVLDADGLNNLSLKETKASVITPHEGELAHLLKTSREKIHANREKVTRQTAQAIQGICVLKGHHTLVSDGKQLYQNKTGNPAMATGGMGDVLTGVIAGLLAQGLSPFEAASQGVHLHGLAGDLAAKADRGLLAHEVADALPKAIAARV
jgi:NAD(P)H-hydrate epimerase